MFLVLWILVMIFTVILVLFLTHFCGKHVYKIADKIYKDFTAEDEYENVVEKRGEKNE